MYKPHTKVQQNQNISFLYKINPAIAVTTTVKINGNTILPARGNPVFSPIFIP